MNRLNGIDGVNQDEWDRVEKEFKEEISNNLKIAIKKKYNRQKDFARIIGISEPTINKWTNGRVAPDLFYIYKICTILDIDIATILGKYYTRKKNLELDEKDIKKLKKIINKYSE